MSAQPTGHAIFFEDTHHQSGQRGNIQYTRIIHIPYIVLYNTIYTHPLKSPVYEYTITIYMPCASIPISLPKLDLERNL